jgi:hypothetical protein
MKGKEEALGFPWAAERKRGNRGWVGCWVVGGGALEYEILNKH